MFVQVQLFTFGEGLSVHIRECSLADGLGARVWAIAHCLARSDSLLAGHQSCMLCMHLFTLAKGTWAEFPLPPVLCSSTEAAGGTHCLRSAVYPRVKTILGLPQAQP